MAYEANCELVARRRQRHEEIDKQMNEVRQKQLAAKMASSSPVVIVQEILRHGVPKPVVKYLGETSTTNPGSPLVWKRWPRSFGLCHPNLFILLLLLLLLLKLEGSGISTSVGDSTVIKVGEGSWKIYLVTEK